MDRYFLRKLRKVKKANGQIIAINEVRLLSSYSGREAVLSESRASVPRSSRLSEHATKAWLR